MFSRTVAIASLALAVNALPAQKSADCVTYRKIVDVTCADSCLDDTVGICPRDLVVKSGGLEAGSCNDAGFSVDKGPTTQSAGPCGTLNFEQWAKSFIPLLVDFQPAAECANTEYCCPDAKHCLTPTKITCANDANVCKNDQVCCPLTKLCVDVGVECTPQCTDGGFCCPDALHCLIPTNPGKICDTDASCGTSEVCCPLIKECVKVGAACTP